MINSLISRVPFTLYLREAYRHRATIRALAVRDFRSRYAGTLGGMIWAVAHPLAIIIVFYFVFAIGFRAQGPSDVPFIVWFVAGLVPWFFFNEALMTITNSVTSNAYLVKKIVFPTEILPLVHIGSGLIPHAIFMSLLIALLVFFRIPFYFERFLVLYYLLCTLMLLLGLGWLLSALQVFYRDISQALGIVLNIWFWATPIVWPHTMIPKVYHWVFQYNPFFYIVEGYRGLLIYGDIRWPEASHTLYFWSVTSGLVLLGAFVFRRLKPEFSDVI